MATEKKVTTSDTRWPGACHATSRARYRGSKKLLIVSAVLLGFTAFHPAATQAEHAIGHDTAARMSIIELQAALEALTVRVAALEVQNSELRAAIATNTAAISANTANIATNIGLIEANISSIGSLEADSVSGLAQYVSVESVATTISDGDVQGLPTVRITGANLQVVNGLGHTFSRNGLGNLIVGYNGDRVVTFSDHVCSIGGILVDTECIASGGVWSVNHKSGSHNIVGGIENGYSHVGGLVVGQRNVINGLTASISGGHRNTASGGFSSVSGGEGNNALGERSSVSGGWVNRAVGSYSSVSGGRLNTANGGYSSVSGGNINTASGLASTVSGGGNRSAVNEREWAAGSLLEPF